MKGRRREGRPCLQPAWVRVRGTVATRIGRRQYRGSAGRATFASIFLSSSSTSSSLTRAGVALPAVLAHASLKRYVRWLIAVARAAADRRTPSARSRPKPRRISATPRPSPPHGQALGVLGHSSGGPICGESIQSLSQLSSRPPPSVAHNRACFLTSPMSSPLPSRHPSGSGSFKLPARSPLSLSLAVLPSTTSRKRTEPPASNSLMTRRRRHSSSVAADGARRAF